MTDTPKPPAPQAEAKGIRRTPTPWRTYRSVNNGDVYIVPEPYSGSGSIALADTEANAAFIVRAVNNHDALLEQVRLLDRALVYEIKKSSGEGDEEGARMKAVTLGIVREVIAKAQGSAP